METNFTSKKTKISFEELLGIFGKEEVAIILRDKLLEQQDCFSWLKFTYDRKKDYMQFRSTDPRTPETKTYFELKLQMLDLESLPTLEKAVKKLNKLAFQFLQAKGFPQTGSDLIDEVKLDHVRETPIESLYEGKLRQVGSRFVGTCPFHQERTPSFTIYTKDNSFHCFGCGKHGHNAIDYLMDLERLEFKDAVRRLS